MTSGTTFRQREIVLGLFPFDDKNEFKKRPCVIVSNEKYNLNHNTFIAIPITSKIRILKIALSLTMMIWKKGTSSRKVRSCRSKYLLSTNP